MKISLPTYLLVCFIESSLSASVPSTGWRLTGDWSEELYNTCHPISGTPNEECAYPYYEVNVPNDGVPVPITNPLVIYTVSHSEDYDLYYTYGPDYPYPEPTSNCTFTLEDGFQFTTAGSYELIPQTVTAISCVPIGGSSSAGDSSESTTTALSSAIPATSATSSYAAAQSTTSTISAAPPYPTAPNNSYAVGTGTGTTAVPSTTGGSNSAVAPGGTSTLVPFTGGGVSSLRTLYSIPEIAFVVGLWVFQ